MELPPDNVRVLITYAAWVRGFPGNAGHIGQKKEWEAELIPKVWGRVGPRWVIYDFHGYKRVVMRRDFQPDSWWFKDGRGK